MDSASTKGNVLCFCLIHCDLAESCYQSTSPLGRLNNQSKQHLTLRGHVLCIRNCFVFGFDGFILALCLERQYWGVITTDGSKQNSCIVQKNVCFIAITGGQSCGSTGWSLLMSCHGFLQLYGDIHGQFYDLKELFRVGRDCPQTNHLHSGVTLLTVGFIWWRYSCYCLP